MTELFKDDLSKYSRFTYLHDLDSKKANMPDYHLSHCIDDIQEHWILRGVYQPLTMIKFDPPIEMTEDIAFFESKEELLMECAIRGIEPKPDCQDNHILTLISALAKDIELDAARHSRQSAKTSV